MTRISLRSDIYMIRCFYHKAETILVIFVSRYTNLLVCNVSWYRYVVRLPMTSVIITREFSKIKVTVNRAESPRRATVRRLRQALVFNTRSLSVSVRSQNNCEKRLSFVNNRVAATRQIPILVKIRQHYHALVMNT